MNLKEFERFHIFKIIHKYFFILIVKKDEMHCYLFFKIMNNKEHFSTH